MDNNAKLKEALKRLIDSTLKTDLDYEIYVIKGTGTKVYFDIELIVEVDRIHQAHENFDKSYYEAVYAFDDTIKKCGNILNIDVTLLPDYTNTGFIYEALDNARVRVKEEMQSNKYYFGKSIIDDIWIDVRYHDDEYVHIQIEAGASQGSIDDSEKDEISNIIIDVTDACPILSEYNEDISWWFDY